MMSSVFFTDIGMKERYLGYLNFLGIPWNLKFLWAPVVDIFGSKRTWMLAVQSAITLLAAVIAGLCFTSAKVADPHLSTSILVTLLVGMAFLAATNDVVIDGYYMEGLTIAGDQAAFTGYRVFAYRLSLVLVKFGIIFAVGSLAKKIPGGSMYTAWGYGFLAAAGTMGLFTAYHFITLPDFTAARKTATTIRKATTDFIASFASYLNIPEQRASFAIKSSGIAFAAVFSVYFYIRHEPIQALAFGLIGLLVSLLLQAHKTVAFSLLFIIFYKIGDEIIFSMGTPFLKRYLLVSNNQLAWMTGLLGLIGSIAGTTAGGLYIKNHGLKKAIWPLTLFMNLNIAAYIWLAWKHPLATTTTGLLTIGAVYCYEQIAAGLGNAALIVYILHTCKKEFKAGHYAIGSAFMSIFSTVFGGFGGIIVEKTGYLNLFVIGLLATIPAMLLMFFVPVRDEPPV
jgi:PAT family beta-lactamase induction signal transducer AmpG